MQICKMTVVFLLVAAGRLSAGDQEGDELVLAQEPVHVKLDIFDAIHERRAWHDRYVEPTLSLRDLIEREYRLYIDRHDSPEVTCASCELVFDNDYYFDRYPGNSYHLNDSVQNHSMIYLVYRKKIANK